MRPLHFLLLGPLCALACSPAGPPADTPAAGGAPTPALVDASSYDPSREEFAGSASCLPCHPVIHAEWAKSSHATTVRKADYSDEEQVASFIECSELFFTQVLGDRHHVRYLVQDEDSPWGEGRWLALPCGWDLHEKEVTLHHPESWRELPWESGCAGCHVTGFRANDHGFLEFGVGCEECHGPAAEHAATAVKNRVLSFAGSSAADEVTVCASCHLQGGVSRSTGLKLPPAYRAGGALFDDYEFDWKSLDGDADAKVLDAHQKILIRAVIEEGDANLRCTSCHSLHGLGHEKHRELPKQEYCLLCHQDDFSLKEYSQSCNVCEF